MYAILDFLCCLFEGLGALGLLVGLYLLVVLPRP